jgi:Tol biopolymer transport system component
VPNVNSVEGEIDPVVSFDDATLYFASGPPNGVDYALWAATRPSPDAAFEAPVELTALNTAGSEVAPDPSSDGQVLYFASTRDGGLGDYDLWYAVRSDAGLAFDSPSRDETLNAEGWDCDPAMSADQRSIYFSSVRPVDAGQRDLWSATRPSSTSPFAAPEPLAALNSAGDDFDPSLSADGLELFFASVRDGQRHIWVARRGPGESFVSAEPVGEINTDGTEIDGGTGAEEWAPGLSPDGRTLYFVTNRAGTLGSTDIWSATRSCL